jgi:hypothetical protein
MVVSCNLLEYNGITKVTCIEVSMMAEKPETIITSSVIDEHHKAYVNTLINMIGRRTKPSDLLCGATTMTSEKSGINQQVRMIANKPKMLLSTLLVVILIMTSMVGCTFTGATQTKIKPLTDKELSSLEAAEQSVKTEDIAVDDLGSSEEIAMGEAYKKAVEAYGWFDLTTMPTAYDTDADVREHEGQQYFRVVHETIKTLADLENYLRSLFSDNIVTNLLFPEDGEKRYRDFDGILYAIPADRGTDINKGEETYEVVQESDSSRIIFRVTVELLGEWDGNKRPVTGYETHDFICEETGGRWVFSSFGLVR